MKNTRTLLIIAMVLIALQILSTMGHFLEADPDSFIGAVAQGFGASPFSVGALILLFIACSKNSSQNRSNESNKDNPSNALSTVIEELAKSEYPEMTEHSDSHNTKIKNVESAHQRPANSNNYSYDHGIFSLKMFGFAFIMVIIACLMFMANEIGIGIVILCHAAFFAILGLFTLVQTLKYQSTTNKTKHNNQENRKTEPKVIENRHLTKFKHNDNNNQKEFPFFFDLFSRLSFVKDINLHVALDFVIYSAFKARLCVIYEIERDESLSDDDKKTLIDKYDALMFLSLGCYFDEHAPNFTYKTHIVASRFEKYESIFQKFVDSPNIMTFISKTLYWCISKGWIKNVDGSNSNIPNDKFEYIEIISIDKKVEEKYSAVHDDVEFIVLPYCERETRELLDSLKKLPQ